MEIRDLTPHGYPGYSIREDGQLFNRHGRPIKGNQQGQVRLPVPGGTEWRWLPWLVAKAFVPEVPGHIHLHFKDGDSQNYHYTNLKWSDIPKKASRKRLSVLKCINAGMSVAETANELQVSRAYVLKIVDERLKELKSP